MESYAAKMIARFQGPPTSRAERAAKRESGEISEAWYVDQSFEQPSTGFKGFQSSQQSHSEQPRSILNSSIDKMIPRQSLDSSLGLGTSLDALIAADIAEIEKGLPDINSQNINMNTKGGMSGSYDFKASSRDYNAAKTDRLESSAYRYGGTREPLGDMRGSGDFFRASVETLGSTGIKGK
jgi:hypothetical protein